MPGMGGRALVSRAGGALRKTDRAAGDASHGLDMRRRGACDRHLQEQKACKARRHDARENALSFEDWIHRGLLVQATS